MCFGFQFLSSLLLAASARPQIDRWWEAVAPAAQEKDGPRGRRPLAAWRGPGAGSFSAVPELSVGAPRLRSAAPGLFSVADEPLSVAAEAFRVAPELFGVAPEPLRAAHGLLRVADEPSGTGFQFPVPNLRTPV